MVMKRDLDGQFWQRELRGMRTQYERDVLELQEELEKAQRGLRKQGMEIIDLTSLGDDPRSQVRSWDLVFRQDIDLGDGKVCRKQLNLVLGGPWNFTYTPIVMVRMLLDTLINGIDSGNAKKNAKEISVDKVLDTGLEAFVVQQFSDSFFAGDCE